MVNVSYSIDDNNNYTKLIVEGHANYDEYGKDLICASVSSIVFGLMNALDEEKDVDINDNNNHIEIVINESSNKINDYLELTMFQLKTLEESYKEYIKIERI